MHQLIQHHVWNIRCIHSATKDITCSTLKLIQDIDKK